MDKLSFSQMVKMLHMVEGQIDIMYELEEIEVFETERGNIKREINVLDDISKVLTKMILKESKKCLNQKK